MTRTAPRPVLAEALLRLAHAAAPLLPLPPLLGDSYAAAHALFEVRSDQRRLLTDWLGQRLEEAARGRAALRVLSVGAGDGRLDAAVAARLLDAHPRLRLDWTCVEPLPRSAEACGARLRAAGPADRLAVTVHVSPVEDLALTGPYDAVTAVHSLYYVRDVGAVLDVATALLAPGGRLLLAQAPQPGLNELGALLAPPQEHPQWWSATTVRALLERDLRGSAVRLLAVLDLGGESVDGPDGAAVLDFTVQARLPEELREPVLDVLRALALPRPGLQVQHPVDLWDLTTVQQEETGT